MLHGILGSGGNLRSLARRMAAGAPEWGFILVDLRMHGMSQDAPPPHTLSAAARDLVALEQSLGLPVDGVMGHSFGGKVALALLAERARPLSLAVVLDSSPGASPESARRGNLLEILDFLGSLPWPLPSREAFIEATERAGNSRPFSEWLAMNVRSQPDGFGLRIDLGAVRALLADYFRTDLWEVVENPPVKEGLHEIVAGRAVTLDASDRERLRRIAAEQPKLGFHLMPNVGHLLHLEDPDGLYAILAPILAAPQSPC